MKKKVLISSLQRPAKRGQGSARKASPTDPVVAGLPTDGAIRALVRTGQSVAALQQLQQTVLRLFEQTRWPQAQAMAQLMTTHFPEQALGWRALGMARNQQGQPQQAVAPLQTAVALAPDDAAPHFTLATTLQTLGRLAEAAPVYRQVLRLRPDDAGAWCNLSGVLIDLDQLAEARQCCGKALGLQPGFAMAWNNLGLIFDKTGQPERALACIRRALQIEPQFAQAHSNLGHCLLALGQLAQAEASIRQALALQPNLAQAHNNLGYMLKDRGQLDAAQASFEAALLHKPDFVEAHSNLLFTLNYHPDHCAEHIYAAYQRFDEVVGWPWRSQWQPHENQAAMPRRLKVGYVASTFFNHSSRHFLEPLLERHDKAAVEVHLYAQQTRSDALTARYQGFAEHWLVTVGLSDAALAARVRADGIDVLVDIAGHTRGNRLLVLARKPAPVSLHWLDFGYTTGLSAIDYYLTDWPTVPAGGEALFSEAPWRLDGPALAYRPDPAMGEVSRLPALRNGFISFGTLTRAVRINHRTLRVWSQILLRVPGAKLVIDSGDFRDLTMQNELAGRFAAYGISRERLLIGFHSPPWDTLRGIDITLDCFPHNSGTTLLESLYMGLPFVTLAGRPSVGTLGAAVLSGLGRTEWVAHSEDAYVEIAVALAADLTKLADIRAGLRAAMQHSPLMDEVGFARRVEAAYRQMFALWVQRQQPGDEAATAAIASMNGAAVESPVQTLVVPPFAIDNIAANEDTERARAEISLQNSASEAGPGLATGSEVEALIRSGHAAAVQQQLQQLQQGLVALFAQQRWAQAEAVAQLLTSCFAHDAFGWNALGEVLNQQGRAAQAVAPLQRAAALANTDGAVFCRLGNTWQKLGQLTEAEAAYRRALALNPNQADAWCNLGVVLTELAQSQEARQCYELSIPVQRDR